MIATRSRCPFGAAVIASVLVITTSASAQGPSALLVELEPCEEAPIDDALLIARLEVELHDDGFDEVRLVGRGAPIARARAEDVRVVGLACAEGAAAFVAQVRDAAGNVLVAQHVDVSGAAESARMRALALALAELLRAAPPVEEAPAVEEAAQTLEREATEPDTTEPDTTEPETTEPETRAPSTSVAGAFVVRAFPSGGIAPLGGRLSVDIAALAPLVVRVDAEGVVGVALDRLGEIDVGLATAGVALVWAAGLGRDVLLTLGGRVAAGVAWAEGRPYDPSTPAGDGAGPIVTVGGVCELDARVVGPVSLRFGVEVGAAVLGFEARVGAIPVAAASGASIAGWAGLAIRD